MSLKSYIKKTSDNDFGRFSLKRTISSIGGLGCILTKYTKTCRGVSLQQYAYWLFHKDTDFISPNKNIKVTPSCGVLNCVKKEHLTAEFVPSKDNLEYLKDWGIADYTAHTLNIPQSLLNQYVQKLDLKQN